MSYLLVNNLLSDKQYGFVKGRSATHVKNSVYWTFGYWTFAMERRSSNNNRKTEDIDSVVSPSGTIYSAMEPRKIRAPNSAIR